MSLIAVKISKNDPDSMAELNDDYHNGDCIIIGNCDLSVEDFPGSFKYVVIDNGEYLIKAYSPLSS
jgi:hypothetical protein